MFHLSRSRPHTTTRIATGIVLLLVVGSLLAPAAVANHGNPIISVTSGAISGRVTRGVEVTFSSSGTTTHACWSWTFGDGNTATTNVPTRAHTYTAGSASVAPKVNVFRDNAACLTGHATESTTITLTLHSLDAVVLSPASATITAGASQSFGASAMNSANEAIPIGTVTWSVLGAGCGSVSNAGLYQSPTVIPGNSCSVRASTTANGITRTADAPITLNPGTVTSVLVSPSSASVTAGVAEPFTATATDAHGNVVAFTPTWTTTCPGDAAIVAGSFGSTTVTETDCKVRATHDATGVFGESTVSVVAGPFAAYRMVPSVTTLTVGATLEVTAVPTDAFGNDVAAHASNEPESWGESCGLVAPTGAYTADYTAPTDLALGSCTVTAFHSLATDGVSTLNLAGGTPVSLVVVPAHVYLAFGDSYQFILEATDGFGNVYAVMPSFLGPFWSVIDGCGEVDSTGLYTAPMATDDCVVTAEYDGDAYMGTAHVNLDGSPPVPELPTLVLTLAGLVGLATFGGIRRFRRSG